jgi:hypothetical protein
MKQEEPSEQEKQMLEVLQEWQDHPNARLMIELRDGTWEIGMTVTIDGQARSARGVGRSFNEAWHNMNPT